MFTPTLIVANASDSDRDSLMYVVEIDTVNTFDSANKQTSGLIPEGPVVTTWTPSALAEDATYYWRAKANDGLTDGQWMATASFFVNTVNEPPTVPTLNNPANNSQVTVLAPTLTVNASTDPDHDAITYEFEVYGNSGLTSLVTGTTGGGASWTLPAKLTDNTWYWWRAQARDVHGLGSGWMATSSFFVNDKGYNDPPTITITKPTASEPATSAMNYTIAWIAADPDSNPEISLYYDQTGAGYSGTLITSGMHLSDPVSNYNWDISGLGNGTYYIYAKIDDGTTVVLAYAAGPIVINRTITLTITATAGTNGSIIPSGLVSVISGATQTFTIAPDTNNRVQSVFVDGVDKGPINSYTFANVTTNHTINATFAAITYTITASAGPNGSILPAGTLTVNQGGNAAFTIIPNSGYQVQSVLVDGLNQGAITNYTFMNVTADHSINASFTLSGADTIAPTGTIVINGGAAYTTSRSVALNLSCTDNVACYQMQFSNDNVTWSGSATYATARNWSLTTGIGDKTVYVKYRDKVGNWSPVYSANINFDNAAPVTTASPVGGTYTTIQMVTLSCSDGTGSGCDQTYYTTDGTPPTIASAVYAGPIPISATTTLRYFSRDRAGNQEAVKTQTYTVDTITPIGTIVINGGVAYTTSRSVTLTLSCTDNVACYQMQLSSDNVTWSSSATYTTTRNWPLTTGIGDKTVYVKYRDKVGNWSPVYSANINFDNATPVTTASPVGGTYTTIQMVTLSCSDGTGSGCDKTYYTTDGTPPTIASAVYAGPIPISATTTMRYFSRDRAGNQEAVRTQTYTVDTIAPTGTIAINGGAAYTTSRSVTLTLSCTDNVACYQMQFSNDNITWSSSATYATTRNWSLTTGNGDKTVYVKYRDQVGNWSPVYSATIIFDNTAPSNGTLNTVASPGVIALTWSGFSDVTSGMSGYTLVYSTTSTPATCSAGTVLYSGTDTGFNHTGVVAGKNYYYRLCASDMAGNVSNGVTKKVLAQ